MKKGKSTSNKVGNIRSTIKNVININLAEKLAQTIKRKKKTKSVRKSKRISSTRQEGQQDFIELKPRGIMPQGNALTSGSAIRMSMPNQMFANKPSILQPSTYAIPDKRVLGSFQPSSFAPRDQERQQSIVEKALIEAIKKTQPSGPDSRIVPSINPYDPNSIPAVADLNAIAADDSQKKKAQSISEFLEDRTKAKRESELEAFDRDVQERRQNIEEKEALRRSLEENIPLPTEEEAGFRKPSKPSQPKRLTRGVIAFLANYYNLTKSQDLKGFSAETVDNYENKVKQINPDIYEEAYRIQYGEAGQAPKNVQTVIPLLEKYIKSKPSVASSSSSSKFSEAPKAVISPSNQPLFSNEPLLVSKLRPISPPIQLSEDKLENYSNFIEAIFYAIGKKGKDRFNDEYDFEKPKIQVNLIGFISKDDKYKNYLRDYESDKPLIKQLFNKLRNDFEMPEDEEED